MITRGYRMKYNFIAPLSKIQSVSKPVATVLCDVATLSGIFKVSFNSYLLICYLKKTKISSTLGFNPILKLKSVKLTSSGHKAPQIHIRQLYFPGKPTTNYLKHFLNTNFVSISENMKFLRLKSGMSFLKKEKSQIVSRNI